MIAAARLLISAFAVMRATRMVNQEDGPFDLFATMRSKVDPKQATWVGRGIACFFCVSFWLGLIAATISPLDATRTQRRHIITDGLAISGAAALLRFVVFKERW